ncbi:MAG: universal stress protein [Actinobacteria bacterium]|nr:universal stress protein [Actinomycetota bacterium]MBV8395032.1 universal stress protein [Actinomycetota bacterium]
MRNPFRSEAEAFRFVIGIVVAAALIVIGSRINVWLGLAVACLEALGVTWWVLFRGRAERPLMQAPPPHPVGERRILVVANETVGGRELLAEIKRRTGPNRTRVLVVSPALNSPVKHWTSDEDGARAAAQERLDGSLKALRDAGIDASGEVGDGDPLQAIEDALRTFAPDELIISTHPEGRSHWLERGVVAGARERFAMPVTHVVVDLAAEHAPVGY